MDGWIYVCVWTEVELAIYTVDVALQFLFSYLSCFFLMGIVRRVGGRRKKEERGRNGRQDSREKERKREREAMPRDPRESERCQTTL